MKRRLFSGQVHMMTVRCQTEAVNTFDQMSNTLDQIHNALYKASRVPFHFEIV